MKLIPVKNMKDYRRMIALANVKSLHDSLKDDLIKEKTMFENTGTSTVSGQGIAREEGPITMLISNLSNATETITGMLSTLERNIGPILAKEAPSNSENVPSPPSPVSESDMVRIIKSISQNLDGIQTIIRNITERCQL